MRIQRIIYEDIRDLENIKEMAKSTKGRRDLVYSLFHPGMKVHLEDKKKFIKHLRLNLI